MMSTSCDATAAALLATDAIGQRLEPPVDATALARLTYFRGRVALEAILRGLGVSAGDEVAIQAFTCIAVPEAVRALGARARYVDVEEGSPNMDPGDLVRKINERTRAVVIQHTFGLPANVSSLGGVAKEHGLPVVEDCAHTIASRVDGRQVGSFGAAAFYSYEASKPAFVGIGGSAVANDVVLAAALDADYSRYEPPSAAVQLQLATMFLAHKAAYRPSTYWTVRSLFRSLVSAGLIRGNYNDMSEPSAPGPDFTRRMGAIQARLLHRALALLDSQTAHRRWVGEEYRTRIRARGVAHFPVSRNVDPVFGRYPVLVGDKSAVLDGAREARVELADFYATPVHPLKGEKLRQVGYEPGSCPNAEALSARIVSLPTGPQVDRTQIQRAVDFFNG